MFDFHVDSHLKITYCQANFAQGSDLLQVDVPKIRKSSLNGLFLSIWAHPSLNPKMGMEYVERQVNILNLNVKPHLSQIDLYYNVEGGHVLNDDPENAGRLRDIGVSKLTLTHFSGPSWAGSEKEGAKGLDTLGTRIVNALNEARVIIDLAHSSHATMLDVLKESKAPVVYSHGGVYAINPCTRSIQDDVIEKICNSGGMIGVSFFPDHLTSQISKSQKDVEKFEEKWRQVSNELFSGEEKLAAELELLLFQYPHPEILPDLNHVFNHIDYIVQNFGEDYVGIGSDFDGVPYTCAGLKNVAEVFALLNLMEAKGYTKTRVEKIMDLNIRRILRVVRS